MAQRLSTLCEVNWVDGICGSGQIGTVKTRGVENAGVDISAQCGKGGQCGSGQIGTVCQGYTRIFTANQTDFAAVVECPCFGFRRDCSILWRCLIHRLCRIRIVKRTYALRFYNRLSTPARKSVSASRASCIRTCSDCPLPHCPPLPHRADKSTPALSTPTNSAFLVNSGIFCLIKCNSCNQQWLTGSKILLHQIVQFLIVSAS